VGSAGVMLKGRGGKGCPGEDVFGDSDVGVFEGEKGKGKSSTI